VGYHWRHLTEGNLAMRRNIVWIALTLACILAGLVSLLPVAMLPMMFDAPGSEANPLTWVLVATIAAFPLFCLIGAVLPWFFRRTCFGGWLFLLPILDVAMVAAALFALGYFCDGRFSC
jgi:hypothetical protein